MPIVIPAGFLQVTIIQSHPGAQGDVLNVFGVENNAAGDANTAAGLIGTDWVEAFLPSQSNDIRLIGVKVSGGPGAPEGFASFNAPGQRGEDSSVINVSVLVKKTTGIAGRKNRGRMYVAGIIEGDRLDSEVDANGLAQWQASADAFLDKLGADSLPMVILHNSLDAPTVVDALVVEARLATQRGRLRD